MRIRYVLLIVFAVQLALSVTFAALLEERWNDQWKDVKAAQEIARQEAAKDRQAAKDELRGEIRAQFQELTLSVKASVAEANADHKKWVRRTVSEYRELREMVAEPAAPATTTEKEEMP